MVESTATREWLFDLVRRFVPRADRDFRCRIAWTLDKVVVAGGRLPTDLIELLGAWVRHASGEDELQWENQAQDPITGAINSERDTWLQMLLWIDGKDETDWKEQSRDLVNDAVNTERGAALHTLLGALALEPGSDALQARWEWMMHAGDKPSVLLRVVAILHLLYLIDKNRDRAVVVFERMAEGMPRLRESRPFQEFLYWGAFGRFARLAFYIEEVMHSGSRAARKRGAELAVVWSISARGLESDAARESAARLAELAVTGPAEWRRGAARIFAQNLVGGPTDVCIAGLRRLLNDEDAEVRREVGGFVVHLREEHVFSLGSFLAEFASSHSFREFQVWFEKYLWEHGLLNPAWALDVVGIILDNPYPYGLGGIGAEEELIRLVLRIYTDPTADTLRLDKAMDTFDRLMKLNSRFAWMALEEWDRV